MDMAGGDDPVNEDEDEDVGDVGMTDNELLCYERYEDIQNTSLTHPAFVDVNNDVADGEEAIALEIVSPRNYQEGPQSILTQYSNLDRE